MSKKMTEEKATEILMTMKTRELFSANNLAFGTRMIVLRNVIKQEIDRMSMDREDDDDGYISESMAESLKETLMPFSMLIDFYDSIAEDDDDEASDHE